MIKNFTWVLLFCFLACKEQKTAEHLPAEKMRAILFDMNVAETYSTMVRDTTYKIGSKNADSLATYYKAIFDHHKITRDEFERSLAWYKANPAEMDSLFSSVIPIATRWQDSLKNKKAAK